MDTFYCFLLTDEPSAFDDMQSNVSFRSITLGCKAYPRIKFQHYNWRTQIMGFPHKSNITTIFSLPIAYRSPPSWLNMCGLVEVLEINYIEGRVVFHFNVNCYTEYNLIDQGLIELLKQCNWRSWRVKGLLIKVEVGWLEFCCACLTVYHV